MTSGNDDNEIAGDETLAVKVIPLTLGCQLDIRASDCG